MIFIPIIGVLFILFLLILFKIRGDKEKRLNKELFEKEKQKNFSEAIRIVEQLIHLRPRFAAYYVDLARIQEKNGNLKESIKIFQKMLEENISSSLITKEKIIENIVRLSLILKDYEYAFKNAWVLWKINSKNVTALTALGRLFASQGQLDKAGEFLFEAIKYEPDNPESRFFLGLCLLDKGDSKNAVVHLEKAYELKNNDKNIIFFLAALYIHVGRKERGLELLSKIGESINSVPQKILNVGILKQGMPSFNLEMLKSSVSDKKIKIRNVDELLGLSKEDLYGIIKKIITKLGLTIKEELKEESKDVFSEINFLCYDKNNSIVLFSFIKTTSDLGAIPLMELLHLSETKKAFKIFLVFTSQLSDSAFSFIQKNPSFTVIDKNKLIRFL